MTSGRRKAAGKQITKTDREDRSRKQITKTDHENRSGRLTGKKNQEGRPGNRQEKQLSDATGERIKMLEYVLPGEIEKRSFEIIGEELATRGIALPDDQTSVTMRVIHTSADFDYAETMCYSQDAVEKAKALIRAGADIVTDTNMALAGINKKALAKHGGQAYCFMADEAVAAEAKERGLTRAAVSMEHAARLCQKTGKPMIFAVGNAPTALIRLHEMMQLYELYRSQEPEQLHKPESLRERRKEMDFGRISSLVSRWRLPRS